MIKKIKWDNHPMLHNLELDFRREDGTPYNTIILAGENGVGKTTVLETLAAFLNLGTFMPFESIQYVIDESIFTLTKDPTVNSSFGFHSRRNESAGGVVQHIRTNRNNSPNRIQEDLEDIRHYGFAYSKARSGFATKAVKSSTTQQLDEEKYGNDNNDDFTPIKQLIIDITEQDNSEWMYITQSGGGTSYEDFRRGSNGFRFENAFNSFFENIQFYGCVRQIKMLAKGPL